MNIPLFAKTAVKIAPDNLDKELELFPAAEIVWERIMCLASLARSIDPSLGDHVRFVKRAPRDLHQRNQVDYEILLTHSQDPHLSYEQSTSLRSGSHGPGNPPQSPDFTLEQALRKVLPVEVVDHELGLLKSAPNFGMAGVSNGVSAAIQQAFLKGNVFFHTEGIVDTNPRRQEFSPDHFDQLTDAKNSSPEVFVSSSPVKVSDIKFMAHPTVARWAWISTSAPHDALNEQISPAVNSIRKDVLFLRSILAKSFFETSPIERQKVVDTITRLNDKRFLSGTFEESYDHGWIGYVAASRPVKQGNKIPRQLSSSSQWTKFLLENKLANLNTTYADYKPAVIALVKNQGSMLNTLLGSGVSANNLLGQYPDVLNRKYQRQLDGRQENSIPLLVLASVMGTKQSATALINNGADPNQFSDQGISPLIEAAAQGNLAWTTFLLNKGADPSLKNPQGDRPEDFVPENQDFLYDLLKKARELKDKGLPLPQYEDFDTDPVASAPLNTSAGVSSSPVSRGPK